MLTDLLIDETGDIAFKGGDLVIGDCENQNQYFILTANKGDFKQHPEIGAALQEMLNDENIDGFLLEAKRQLEYDGMTVNNISFEDGKLIIDGKY